MIQVRSFAPSIAADTAVSACSPLSTYQVFRCFFASHQESIKKNKWNSFEEIYEDTLM